LVFLSEKWEETRTTLELAAVGLMLVVAGLVSIPYLLNRCFDDDIR
jgi:hypothetical protein